MPLPMVHLAVAHALKDEPFAKGDLAAYFLGANAPDSIHKREGWTGYDKDVSHIVAVYMTFGPRVRATPEKTAFSPAAACIF